MDRLRGALAEAHDPLRPLARYEVLDTGGWSATGPSWITIRVDGVARRAAYRDGVRPPVGSRVQAMAMSGDATATLLALPVPRTGIPNCDSSFYILINGTVAEPPDVFPDDGSLGDAILRVVFTLSPLCRHIYNSLRTWRVDPGTGTIEALYRSDIQGPVDGPLTGYVQAQVPGPGVGSYAYLVQYIINDAPLSDPATPGY